MPVAKNVPNLKSRFPLYAPSDTASFYRATTVCLSYRAPGFVALGYDVVRQKNQPPAPPFFVLENVVK